MLIPFIVPNYFIKSSAEGAIEAPSQKAVIIKGSPRYIENNPKADKFYEELAKILSNSGYETSYDAGEPYTIPDETAQLWIAHSRGQDRLQYAPESVKTLAIDQYEHRAKERREINRKLMEAAGAKSWAEWEDRPDPPDEHYQITDDLRKAIRELIASKSEPVTKSSAINGTEEDLKGSKSPVEGIKEDRRYLTITRPLKSSLTGFTTNSKGKLATPDKRFNLINGERKLVKESASKFNKLFREGKLSQEAARKLEAAALFPTFANKGLGWKNETGDLISVLRKTTKKSDKVFNDHLSLPAQEAYNTSFSPSAALRHTTKNDVSSLIFLQNRDNQISKLRQLQNSRILPKRDDPMKMNLGRALRQQYARLFGKIKPWTKNKSLTDRHAYDPNTNTVHSYRNTPDHRHETAHWANAALFSKYPSKYHSATYSPLHFAKTLGGKQLKDRILSDPTYLEELRTQYIATVGKGNKSKLVRSATNINQPELNDIRRKAEELVQKQPHFEDKIKATVSALEHLNSNYRFPIK
jgi:hypothetical protein